MTSISFDLNRKKSNIIKVIGVGGGGSNAVNYMHSQGIHDVDFVICNTDRQALEDSGISTKIQLGPNLTEGRGAGSKPEQGRQACLESLEEIREFLANDTKMVFITAGMGGGTGTGAAPVIAQLAQEMDILTVAIVTMPFEFEGRPRMQNAKDGLNELIDNVDAYVVITNDKLFDIYNDLTMTQGFTKVDSILTNAAKGIAELITVSGYINVDFEDVNTVMRASGRAIMGIGHASGPDRAKEAVDMALTSPLLEDNSVTGAKNVLLYVSHGDDEPTMREIKTITDFIDAEIESSPLVIWGTGYDPNLNRGEIGVSLIATGFDEMNAQNKNNATELQRVVLGRQIEIDLAVNVGNDANNKPKVIEFDTPVPAREGVWSESDEALLQRVRAERNLQRERYENLRKEVLQKNKGNDSLESMENIPAYLRRGVPLEGEEAVDEASEWNLSADDELETRQGNRYLHRHVD